MKQMISFLLLICFILLPGLKYIDAQGQVQVKLLQPPPNQLRSTDLWKLTLINTTRNTLQISLKGTLEEAKSGIIVDGTSPQLNLLPGTKIITYDDVKKGNVNFKSGKWQDAFTRTGNAPSGDYTICISVVDKSGQEIGKDCIQQNVEISGAPLLASPADGDNIPAGTLPNFTWMPPVPVPPGILYSIKVVEILGDESPEVALNQNKAWFSKDKLKSTTFQYPSTAPNLIAGKKYAWTVLSTQTSGEQSTASEVFSFKVTNNTEKSMMGGANADFTLDTIYCMSSSGNMNYYHIKATYKNSSTSTNNILINDNGAFTGNAIATAGTGYNLQNNIRTKSGTYNPLLLIKDILESNNGTISNINTPPFNFITQLIPGQSLHFEFDFSTSASTVQFTFYGLVDDALKGQTNKNPRNEILTINKFPPCPCNPCKGKSTIFGKSGSAPNYTYQNTGSVSENSTVTFSPDKVIKVTAEIVDVERFGQSGCLSCTNESKEFGNYTSGSLNNNGGNITNGTNGYGKQIGWQFPVPTLINNYSYDLEMMFPPLTAVSCCKDSIRICTRWSFTDANCITCDTLVCSVITRDYQPTKIYVFTPGLNGQLLQPGNTNAAQTKEMGEAQLSIPTSLNQNSDVAKIKEMGEPYLSWYNQESNDLPNDFEEQSKKLYDNLKVKEVAFSQLLESYKTRFYGIRELKMGSNLGSLLSSSTMCGNGDFENGSIDPSEWTGASASTMGNTFTYSPWVTGIIPVNGLPLNSSATVLTNHQTIVSAGPDPTRPNVGAILNTVPPHPSVDHYSLRLGNSVNGGYAEKIEKSFVVPSSPNSILRFWYAAVFLDPTSGHADYEKPSFRVRVYDGSNTRVLNLVHLNGSAPLDSIYADSNNPFFVHAGVDSAEGCPIVVRQWTCAQIDLSTLANQTVRVEFINTDCSQGGHYGYTYLDNFCLDCIGNPSGNVSIQTISDSCIKQGTQVCVNYTLPQSGSTIGSGTIKLQFYQNGNPVSYSLTSPNLTASGTHCFTIDPSQLPCTSGSTGYDVVATGNFSITVGGTTTPITVTSPDPLGNYQGIKPGFNNDLVCCGTPADNCCTNFTKDVSTVVTMVGNSTSGYNSIKFVPTFNVGPKLIKQVRISVVNFEITSSNKECLTCEANTGKYGTMSVPQNVMGGGKDPIEGMVYPTKPLTMACFPIPCPTWNALPSSEVTWGTENGPGYNLMDNIGDQTTTFFISLPKQSTLSCCDETINICIKYSFTDIDCVTCETVVCYKTVNRKVISATVTAGQGKG